MTMTFGPLTRSILVFAFTTLASAGTAFAQRVDLGVTYGTVRVSDGSLTDDAGFGWIAQLVPHEGWGLSGALNWYGSDVAAPGFVNLDGRLGRLNVRPLLGGVGYTVLRGRLATSYAIVAGPAINTLHLDQVMRDRVAQEGGFRGSVWSFAVRPGVSATYTIHRRWDLIGFAGYIVNRPQITLRTPAGSVTQHWKTDALVVNGGIAVRLF
jgi:hypothetical protein